MVANKIDKKNFVAAKEEIFMESNDEEYEMNAYLVQIQRLIS